MLFKIQTSDTCPPLAERTMRSLRCKRKPTFRSRLTLFKRWNKLDSRECKDTLYET